MNVFRCWFSSRAPSVFAPIPRTRWLTSPTEGSRKCAIASRRYPGAGATLLSLMRTNGYLAAAYPGIMLFTFGFSPSRQSPTTTTISRSGCVSFTLRATRSAGSLAPWTQKTIS